MTTPPLRCAHPQPFDVMQGTVRRVARWCTVCGALNLDAGLLASQWMQPKASELHRVRERLVLLLAAFDGALSEPEPPR